MKGESYFRALDRKPVSGSERPAVPPIRVGCKQRVCTCHDDSAWRPGSYLNGCSQCGCRRKEG